MGNFATATQVKDNALSPQVTALSDTVLEDMYIVLAERILEEAYNLNLNSANTEPNHWEDYFDTAIDGAARRVEWQRDIKAATIWLVNRMVINPHEFKSQGMGSASAAYGRAMPSHIGALLRRWARARIIYR